MSSKVLDFLLQALTQFAGGPGPMENNLVRFGLTAILWGVLLLVAWARQRGRDLPRERLLVWGFGFGLASASLMAGFVSLQMLGAIERETSYVFLVSSNHVLELAAIVVVAGAFLRYVLDDARLARNYLLVGLGTAGVCYVIALWQWPRLLDVITEAEFHATWGAWLFDVPSVVLLIAALILLRRKPGWVCNAVSVALTFFLVSELLLLANYATDRHYGRALCPIGNSLSILAIPLLGYVYLREQAVDKQRAERALDTYRQQLEDLVAGRTAELTVVNARLTQEVGERRQAEEMLGQLSRRYATILEAAGEGICGIDCDGRFVFVNRAAAQMLGYGVDELVGKPCHQIWHHSSADGTPYPEDSCPLHAGYTLGLASKGEEEFFWRKDNTGFPIMYVSSPTYQDGVLTGAVVIFRDISERKRSEAEIAARNASLAAQNAVAATLSRSLDLALVLDAALDVVLSIVQMDVGFIFLLDPDAGELVLRSRRGQIAEWAEPDRHCCMAVSVEAVTDLRAVVRSGSDFSDHDAAADAAGQRLAVVVSAPLVSKGRAVGALTLGSRRAEHVPPATLALLTAIGQQIGMATEHARLFRAAEHSAEVLSLLHQASVSLASTLDAARIYDQIAVQAAQLLDCRMACVLTWDEAGQQGEMVSSYGISEAEGDILRMPPEPPGCLQDFIACHQAIAVDDAQDDQRVPLAWRERLGLRAFMCVPIRDVKAPLGTLFVMDRRAARHWRPEDVALIESFVGRAAVALMNANLHKQVEWAAALEERQRIAADMHDGLAQVVGLLGLRIDEVMALTASRPGRPSEALAKLTDIRETVDQVAVEVRRSIASLSRPPEPRRSLQQMLATLREHLSPQGDGLIEWIDTVEEPLFLPHERGAEVLLVVQEALLNARRHGQAQRISLLLERRDSEARIVVEDNGRGFDPNAPRKLSPNHFGLSIMQARAARIGGSLQIDSAPGQGTRVTLTVPHRG